ncbi:acetyltransferase [Devosia sp.]|uniref:acetyltransferase n=1 Tax=Devosia sp. TaxID=1871048 RepID=UPI001AC19D7F|nr:acetyltransferase [Devosia sp.]MBN9334340.1 acetyltransferase [Devosia sp.]
MIEIRMSTSQDMPRVLDIWRRAVDATHDFLAPADRAAIEAEVSTFLPQVSLLLAVDASGVPQGFMFLHEGHLEALFIDPDHHGQGIGKALIERALVEHPNLTTDVNEQNPRALGFYERVGFERTGRSALDGQGRAYPLIHLRYRS